MDPSLLLGPAFTLRHRHGDEWVTLDPSPSHDPASFDPERQWSKGTIYACPRCDEQISVVREPEAVPRP